VKAVRWVGSAVVGAALLCGARTASASGEFFPRVLELGWTGDCTLCHTVQPGTGGTATKKFAQTLQKKGLKPKDVASLNVALAALTDEDNGDGDLKSDFEELMMGEDPNVPNGGVVEPNEPVLYGCFNSVVARHDVPANGAGVFAGLLTAAALWRTRSRVSRAR
jgi:hypothetical protein